ncbi:MAG: hypothetical protein MJ154_03315 [Candidatus Saccharibacteria bacterium]|nr:hypothetical protein [Candidatus Saccharibacteria bacterium]
MNFFLDTTITETLEELIAGMEGHSYVLITESSYEAWKMMSSFRCEAIAMDRANKFFKKKRISIEAIFQDDDYRWVVNLVETKHPHASGPWLFITSILRDGQVVAEPKIDFETYQTNVLKK